MMQKKGFKTPSFIFPLFIVLLLIGTLVFGYLGAEKASAAKGNPSDVLGKGYSILSMFLIDQHEPSFYIEVESDTFKTEIKNSIFKKEINDSKNNKTKAHKIYYLNWQWALASLFAAILVGLGILSAAYQYLYYQWMLLLIRYKYTEHTIIYGIDKIGFRIASELLKAGQKVVAIEPNIKNNNINKIREKGGYVIVGSRSEQTDLLNAGITRASNCLIFKENDESNLATANLISYMNQSGVIRQNLRVQILTYDINNYNFLKDYMDEYTRTDNYNMDPFNPAIAAAQIIFDNFSPIKNVSYEPIRNEEGAVQNIQSSDNAIVIVGFTDAARAFIMENIILSHSPGIRNLKILLIEKNAKKHFEDLKFSFPFISEYVDITPMELENEHFYGASFESESFKNYLNKLSGVYFFGEKDAILTQMANSFRQTLYKEIGDLNKIPLVVCLPENSKVMDLLDPDTIQSEGLDVELFTLLREEFNINFIKLLTDTCTKEKLIDEISLVDGISKAINYFYSVKYEFEWLLTNEERALFRPTIPTMEEAFLNLEFKSKNPEEELENVILGKLSATLNKPIEQLRKTFSINARWDSLSDLKQDSNRYVARHLQIKVAFLEKMGHDISQLDRSMVEPYFKVFSPIEHKRWCSEKLCFKFKNGPFPENNGKLKELLKDMLKTHDQLIRYNALDKEMEDKDFNMFLLIPVLQKMKSILQHNN